MYLCLCLCAYLQIQACLQSIVEMPVADRLKAADLWNEASLKLQQMLNEDSTSTSAASIKSEENIEKEVRERKTRISVSLLFIIITDFSRFGPMPMHSLHMSVTWFFASLFSILGLFVTFKFAVGLALPVDWTPNNQGVHWSQVIIFKNIFSVAFQKKIQNRIFFQYLALKKTVKHYDGEDII